MTDFISDLGAQLEQAAERRSEQRRGWSWLPARPAVPRLTLAAGIAAIVLATAVGGAVALSDGGGAEREAAAPGGAVPTGAELCGDAGDQALRERLAILRKPATRAAGTSPLLRKPSGVRIADVGGQRYEVFTVDGQPTAVSAGARPCVARVVCVSRPQSTQPTCVDAARLQREGLVVRMDDWSFGLQTDEQRAKRSRKRSPMVTDPSGSVFRTMGMPAEAPAPAPVPSRPTAPSEPPRQSAPSPRPPAIAPSEPRPTAPSPRLKLAPAPSAPPRRPDPPTAPAPKLPHPGTPDMGD